MNNTTHTPGPWKAVQHPHEHKWAWTIEGADEGGQSIARMGLVNDAKAVAANAHLIAAAPAMYEALVKAMVLIDIAALEEENRAYRGEQQPITSEARDRQHLAQAALAQAEGSKP